MRADNLRTTDGPLTALKAWRLRNGFTQQDLAITLGISRSTWIRYEVADYAPKWCELLVAATDLGFKLRTTDGPDIEPSICPVCGSIAIEGDSIDCDGETCEQEMGCSDCEAQWLDTYTRTNTQIYEGLANR
jgi:DNA-binding XRE family transcriptional regulator